MTTTHAAFILALVGCSVALVALVVLIVAVRTIRALLDRRRAVQTSRWRPLVIGWMNGGAEQATFPTRRRDKNSVVTIASELLPKLRGGDRDALAAVLAHHGVLTSAIQAVGSRRSVVRLRAAVLLDVLARDDDVDVLVGLLGDRDPQVRVVAARALGRIGSPAAIPPLMRGLQHRSLPSNTVSMAIVRIGPQAITPLLGWLYSNDARCRCTAVELLGFLGATEAAFDLVNALDDEDLTVATAAARTLGRLGRPIAVDALLAKLEHEYDTDELDVGFCIACVTSLGQIGDRRAIPLLSESLARSHRLSAAAATALEMMGPRRSLRSQQARTEIEQHQPPIYVSQGGPS